MCGGVCFVCTCRGCVVNVLWVGVVCVEGCVLCVCRRVDLVCVC